MPVNLEIKDGDPWWLSPDIWTVPGTDPEGAEGLPIVGETCYIWARVTNNGNTLVNNATVRFYWANPAAGFDRTTANLIGTSFVTLSAGETANVLCLTPWIPEFVNEGHECVLAEAFHPLDPLPAVKEFNVPTDRHVAQRNLSVVQASRGMFKFAFMVHNPERKGRSFQIQVRQESLEQMKPLIRQLGPQFEFPSREGQIQKFGFVKAACPSDENLENSQPEIEELEVKPGQRVGLTLMGIVEGGAALIHVEQFVDGSIVGGLSLMVI